MSAGVAVPLPRDGARESFLGRFAGDALLYNLAALGASAVSVALVPILTRLFAPDVYGVADTALQVAGTVSTLLVMGMDSAVARQFFDHEDAASRARALSTGLGFLALVGASGSLVAFLCARPLSAVLLGSVAHAALLRLAVLAVPCLILEAYFRNVFRWRGERWRYFTATVAGSAVRLLLSLAFALAWGIAGMIAGAVLGLAASTVLGFILAHRAVRHRPDPSSLPGMLAFGIPMAALGLAWPATVLVDRAVLVHFRSEWDLGIYAAAFKLAAFYTLLTEGMRQSWGPLAFSQWNRPGFGGLYARLLQAFLLGGVAVVCVLSLLAREAAALILGPAYRGAYLIVAPLATGLLAADLFNMLGIGLYYRRWSGRFALLGWLAVVLGGIGAIVLVPALGGAGAAIAGALGRTVAAAGAWAVSQRALRVAYPWRRLLPVLLLVPLSGWAGARLDLHWRLGLGAMAVVVLGRAAWQAAQATEGRTLARDGVLFVVSTLEVGGAEVQTREVASALAARGIPITILTLYRLGPIADLPFHPSVRILTARKRGRFDLAGGLRALAIILRARPAIVHGLLFESRMWAALAAALSPARLVVSEHAIADYPWLHGRAFAFLARRARACVVSSKAAASQIRTRYGVPGETIRVVPNAVPPACWDYRWSAPSPSARPTIGVVGRLEHPIKGHDVLFEAVARMAAAGQDVAVEVVGDGPDRVLLEARAAAHGIAERVRFSGEQVPPWPRLVAWSVLVVPSLREGFGNVVVEGLAVGVPIVATDCGGPSEILAGGEGLLVAPGDPSALAAALARVLAEPEEAARRARSGQALARDRFSVEAMTDGMVAVYAHALGGEAA